MKEKKEYLVFQLLPNFLTILAICAGVTSIRFGAQGHYMPATQLILLACVLDGLDGRLARLLNADSLVGAELDSLADFLNFGVAPPLLIYFWALQDIKGIAWVSVLVYTVCCVIRLARFNVSSKSDDGSFFIGIPSPVGALLVMLPMYVSFAFDSGSVFPGYLICIYMVIIALLLISPARIPSFKNVRVSREYVKYLMVGFVVLVAAIVIHPWLTFIVLCLVYVGLIAWLMITRRSALGSER